MDPVISVIIPARNEAANIGRCVKALLRQTVPWDRYEVIVVDDGSEDETAQVALQAGAQVIRGVGAGPAAARNLGARAARGTILVFTDADCEASPTFLEAILDALTEPGVDGVMGAYATRQQEPVARFVQQEFVYKQSRLARLRWINTVHTYAAAYRREVFEESGGFDEAYPVPSNEDQELSFRLAAHGCRFLFVPEAVVYHQHDRVLGEYLRRKFGLGYWKAYTLFKHRRQWSGDSHTPPSQILQIVLIMPMTLVFLLSLAWADLLPVALGLLILFAASAVPFHLQVMRRDPRLLWLTPAMLLLRAGAQAAGLAAGFFRFWLSARRQPREEAILR